MAARKIHHLKNITDFHRNRGLGAPEHPLLSLVNYSDIQLPSGTEKVSWVCDFYSIAVKRNLNTKIHYGQQDYDFDEGVMFFVAPGQVFSVSVEDAATWERSGWILLIHPDFLWNTALAKSINEYEFFGYSVHEALHLSEKEELAINMIANTIKQEYSTRLDKFSTSIIVAQLETMLSYADRFYQRQFITRSISNHKILDRFEEILHSWFNNTTPPPGGLPTVQYIADTLNISPNYLSGLLRSLTGQSTQQHIQDFLVKKAKEKLSATSLSVSEIAYELGFEYPQSFSKLFKAKTDLSPLEFRARFN